MNAAQRACSDGQPGHALEPRDCKCYRPSDSVDSGFRRRAGPQQDDTPSLRQASPIHTCQRAINIRDVGPPTLGKWRPTVPECVSHLPRESSMRSHLAHKWLPRSPTAAAIVPTQGDSGMEDAPRQAEQQQATCISVSSSARHLGHVRSRWSSGNSPEGSCATCAPVHELVNL